MSHIDCRALVLLILALAPAGARAQFVGQANDAAEVATIATQVGEIRMPADSAPVTRMIDADFYGDADVVDWYVINVVDQPPASTSCMSYGVLQLAVTPVFTAAPPPPGSLQVYGGPDLTQVNALGGSGVAGDQNTVRLVNRWAGNTCGSSARYYILVHRSSDVATPLPYTLSLELTRDFGGRGIRTISPSSGAPGTAVTITGVDLIPPVKFGGVDAPITSFVTANSTTNGANSVITAIVPADAKTGVITAYTTPSQQVFTVMAPAAVGPSGPRGASLSPGSLSATPGCCAVAPNPTLVGRLGRLVVSFPPAAVPTGTQVAVVKDGKDLQTGYGNQAWELLPGTYDLKVSGKTVTNVTVQARSDTTVRVGVLRVSASSQTRWEVVDGSALIARGYGTQLVGLPIGTYGLRVSGQTESVAIRDGQVTDF